MQLVQQLKKTTAVTGITAAAPMATTCGATTVGVTTVATKPAKTIAAANGVTASAGTAT